VKWFPFSGIGIESPCMDLNSILDFLRAERAKVDAAIAALEQLVAAHPETMRSGRGRKQMGSEERQEVSSRMKQYWASRRRVSKKTRNDDSRGPGPAS
jgi:hypothetical protein